MKVKIVELVERRRIPLRRLIAGGVLRQRLVEGDVGDEAAGRADGQPNVATLEFERILPAIHQQDAIDRHVLDFVENRHTYLPATGARVGSGLHCGTSQ